MTLWLSMQAYLFISWGLNLSFYFVCSVSPLGFSWHRWRDQRRAPPYSWVGSEFGLPSKSPPSSPWMREIGCVLLLMHHSADTTEGGFSPAWWWWKSWFFTWPPLIPLRQQWWAAWLLWDVVEVQNPYLVFPEATLKQESLLNAQCG